MLSGVLWRVINAVFFSRHYLLHPHLKNLIICISPFYYYYFKIVITVLI